MSRAAGQTAAEIHYCASESMRPEPLRLLSSFGGSGIVLESSSKSHVRWASNNCTSTLSALKPAGLSQVQA